MLLPMRRGVARPAWFTLALVAACAACGEGPAPVAPAPPVALAPGHSFDGAAAGAGRSLAGVPFRWCPAGTFAMGSPSDEPERRPGEDRVTVTLTRGFWTAEHEVTQGEWTRVVGALPG